MIKKPVGKKEYLEFRRHRLSAFMSMDKDKLIQYCCRYHIPYPEDDKTFWEGIHKARVTIHDLPLHEIEKSAKWLKDKGLIIPGVNDGK